MSALLSERKAITLATVLISQCHGKSPKGSLMRHLHRHTAEAGRHTAEARRHTAEARRDAAEAPKAEHPAAVVGRQFVRYALVVVIAWIGALQYSSYEA